MDLLHESSEKENTQPKPGAERSLARVVSLI